ncbi:hypothetical protein HPB47_022871 [Ixodes persulcatus]|uniref:Uncharacterized protein n=1 Tax=Ixodes persulcatus TaxID=34615 RepID=A0AC60Q9A1_IXOPE|nr:hypothetical protein HPB47_022871 [Ixodes persulcatus]
MFMTLKRRTDPSLNVWTHRVESEAVSFDTERRRCPKCCVLFSTRGTMLRHLALHAPKYQCDICFKLFSRKQYTLLHRKIKHGIDFGPY